jgi:hypothetical protein
MLMTGDSIKSRARCALLLIGTALLLAACAAGLNELVDTGPDPAGLWLGLWQRLISPITFIVSLFTAKVNVYEVQNNGNWYDFGFMLVWLAHLAAAGGVAPQGRGVRGSAAATSDSDHRPPPAGDSVLRILDQSVQDGAPSVLEGWRSQAHNG